MLQSLALVGILGLATLGLGTTYAAFSSSAANSPNTFGAATLSPLTSLGASPGGGVIDLSWTETVDSYAEGYKIMRATTSGGPYSQIATVTPRSVTTYEDSGVSPGTTYYYVLRSYILSWESVNSNEASAAISTSEDRFAGSGVSEGLFEMVWSAPSNIGADDNSDSAILDFDNDEIVQRLRSSNYGFTIPVGATIVGIEVQVEIHDDSGGGGADVTDQEARLVKAGVPVGADKSMPGAWPTTRTVRTYGGPSDLWGTTWTPAEINAADFGFGLRSGTSGNGDNSKVDYHRIIVTYSGS